MVRMDMRYIWSEMDSPCLMWKRHQPSRLVVFRRSRRWKNGIGLVGTVEGGGVGRVASTVCGVSTSSQFGRWLSLWCGRCSEVRLPASTDQGFDGAGSFGDMGVVELSKSRLDVARAPFVSGAACETMALVSCLLSLFPFPGKLCRAVGDERRVSDGLPNWPLVVNKCRRYSVCRLLLNRR